MTKCDGCDRKFPSHLIGPMATTHGTIEACPLCLLKIRNEIHGLPEDTPFHGPIAAAMWQEATYFLKTKAGNALIRKGAAE